MVDLHTFIGAGAQIWLSYPLGLDTPAYGGGEGLQLSRLTAISRGDTANTLLLSFPNHLGTHVDVPSHFFEGGQDLTSYAPSDWVFTRPLVVDVEVPDGGLVMPADLGGKLTDNVDLLLIRTGHGRSRGNAAYWAQGPGLAPELGKWIRDQRPAVRAVGMDLISATSRLRREEGRACHRAFLDPHGRGTAVRLIEDMALSECPEELQLVVVSPLVVHGADGAPVTVWAVR